MDITGKIIWAGELRSGISQQSQQQWASQDFVIEAQFNGPTGITIQRVAFNVFGQDKLAEYALRVGDECTVYYGVNAREYQGKWYNDIRAYKVEKKAAAQPGAVQQVPMQQMAQYAQQQFAQQQAQQQAQPWQPPFA